MASALQTHLNDLSFAPRVWTFHTWEVGPQELNTEKHPIPAFECTPLEVDGVLLHLYPGTRSDSQNRTRRSVGICHAPPGPTGSQNGQEHDHRYSRDACGHCSLVVLIPGAAKSTFEPTTAPSLPAHTTEEQSASSELHDGENRSIERVAPLPAQASRSEGLSLAL
jgi:hypothetical protein